ncbi:MAG: hypothetical protein LBJ11_05310, partial [Oscillospiraceae bacterium]|nr:hypothetical protein [Oscillospiraceae bacterium]
YVVPMIVRLLCLHKKTSPFSYIIAHLLPLVNSCRQRLGFAGFFRSALPPVCLAVDIFAVFL